MSYWFEQPHTLVLARSRIDLRICGTAFSDDAVRARALQAGAICFLTKPLDRLTLIKPLGPPPCLSRAVSRHLIKESRGTARA